jgi:hypothetical protein
MKDEARAYFSVERFRLLERQPGARIVFVADDHSYDCPYRDWCIRNCSGAWWCERKIGAAVFLDETDETLFRTRFGGQVQS